jgi:hypothetical protein
MSRNKKKFTLDVNIPVVPVEILQSVQEIAVNGDTLQSDDGIEWYLFNADGELVEVFWIEK